LASTSQSGDFSLGYFFEKASCTTLGTLPSSATTTSLVAALLATPLLHWPSRVKKLINKVLINYSSFLF